MPNQNENAGPPHGEIAAASTILKALANEHRLLALLALAQRPLAVNELNRQLPLAQSALSQHLARLRDAGLVVCERHGSRVRYALADARVRRLVETIRSEYSLQAQANGLRLGIAAADQPEPTVASGAARRL
jgi:DNA-binding transcriptional ArsR family regulator